MSKVYKYRANQITSNREKDSILPKNIIFASPIKFKRPRRFCDALQKQIDMNIGIYNGHIGT